MHMSKKKIKIVEAWNRIVLKWENMELVVTILEIPILRKICLSLSFSLISQNLKKNHELFFWFALIPLAFFYLPFKPMGLFIF